MPFGLHNAGQTFQHLMDIAGAGLASALSSSWWPVRRGPPTCSICELSSRGCGKTASFLKGQCHEIICAQFFFIDHILLVLLEVLYEDFTFHRIFAVLFNQKGNSLV
jgi:hypothetical protein